jgi:hypothetical protein
MFMFVPVHIIPSNLPVDSTLASAWLGLAIGSRTGLQSVRITHLV